VAKPKTKQEQWVYTPSSRAARRKVKRAVSKARRREERRQSQDSHPSE